MNQIDERNTVAAIIFQAVKGAWQEINYLNFKRAVKQPNPRMAQANRTISEYWWAKNI